MCTVHTHTLFVASGMAKLAKQLSGLNMVQPFDMVINQQRLLGYCCCLRACVCVCVCVCESEPLRAVQARRMLREADANGDGLVSREEFSTLLTETHLPDSLDQYDARLQQSVQEMKSAPLKQEVFDYE